MTDLVAVLEESRRLGFLGPGPIEPHLTHATAFAEAVETEPARALDLGAGGGLPGLVLAVERWTTTIWTMLDAQLKRTRFLTWAVEELDLGDRITVVTGRAEEIGRDVAHRGVYDVVTARSFAAPAITAECGAPLLTASGVLLVSEPPEPDVDRWPADGLATVGLSPAERLRIGSDPVHLARLHRVGPVSDRFPRRVGIPAKRPLF